MRGPDDVLAPITLERVRNSLDDLGFTEVRTSDAQILFDFAAFTFVLSLQRDKNYASMHTSWPLPKALHPGEEQLLAVLDWWNRERYFPTLYLIDRPHGITDVFADYVVMARFGLSSSQLDAHLVLGATVCVDAIEFVQWSVEALRGSSTLQRR